MDAFFLDKVTTPAECDQFAIMRFGGQVEPVKYQGAVSYTLIAGNGGLVVQFRQRGSAVPDPDAPLFQTFVAAHSGLVAIPEHCGSVGTLEAYWMPKLQGDSFAAMLDYFDLEPGKLMILVEDLAKYVQREAKPSQIRHKRPGELGRVKKACLKRLVHLDETLPSRFRHAVRYVRDQMEELFDLDTNYPCVPVHGDRSLFNIHVNDTGNLTGVVDFAELSLLPFGFDFHVIDELVSECSLEGGWTEHADAAAVRTHFGLGFYRSRNYVTPKYCETYGWPGWQGFSFAMALGLMPDSLACWDFEMILTCAPSCWTGS